MFLKHMKHRKESGASNNTRSTRPTDLTGFKKTMYDPSLALLTASQVIEESAAEDLQSQITTSDIDSCAEYDYNLMTGGGGHNIQQDSDSDEETLQH